MSQQNHPPSTSWLELSRENLLNNIQELKKHYPKEQKFSCVLKGNAYGHGLLECLEIAHAHVDCICVITLPEALFIRNWERENKQKELTLLVLGTVNEEEMQRAAHHRIDVAIGDVEALKVGKMEVAPLRVHIHLDTGLGREGFRADNIAEAAKLLNIRDDLSLVGIMTHFANTEDVLQQEYANKQLQSFQDLKDLLLSSLKTVPPELTLHTAASSPSLVLHSSLYNMVRVGISLYGLWPSEKTQLGLKAMQTQRPKLKPVLSWKVYSQTQKSLHPGESMGYGCSWVAQRTTRIAVFPVGYYDGLPWSASHKAFVLIQGKRCPIVGRIMMNHIIVDVTDIPNPQALLLAVIIGQDGNNTISAEDIGQWAQSFNYEVVTRIGQHLKRVIV